ncbi:homoserine dehydrogenase [Caldalkalibacillus mannanilyticus]|uniref:homoserine dehydrogenase n=1 Tax=Caldalkalibacillus mannanilyticus TaxID=1418 RepID=UPI000685EF93|nr:homoserine dehydrogenase [Caldalkalibacillus mannanilyticus]
MIRQLLQTNDVEEISGILNGTTNYILTQMEENNAKYEDVLKEAQELGYAEADPTSDVDGYDAMYKLYILSQLVYGRAPELPSIRREGISGIGLTEIQVAKQLGYRFKLLASAKQEGEHLALSVQPTLVSLEHPLAQVNDVNNAVFLKGNIVGELLLSGKGAGEFPTASAVVEDLSFLLTQIYTPQKEWKVDQGVSPEGVFHKSTEERTSSEHFFIYIETKEKDLSKLYVLLEELDQHQLTLHQVQTMETEEKKLAIGLIVQGAPQPFTQYLIDAFSVYVTCHQVIGDQEHPLPIQSVSKELNIAEHQAVNL